MRRAVVLSLGLMLTMACQSSPGVPPDAEHIGSADHRRLGRDIFQELVGINTVTAAGDTAAAAAAMETRLRSAGFAGPDLQVFGPAPRKGNLVARLRGDGTRRPMILLAHLDVVEARREDWSFDPFTLVEQDGYFYGRGVLDDKSMAAVFVANMIRYRQEGFVPSRDIILILETDEEVLDVDGVGIRWLLEHHRDLVDAEFALNEGANVALRNGRPLWNAVQTSEKVPANFQLEVTNPGGHSSLPARENAIYRLAAGLSRLAAFEFPMMLNETTRAWLERAAEFEDPAVGADMRGAAREPADPAAVARLSETPAYNAQLRTTCVATMLEAGHAFNALPQTARATVNCRVLPGHPMEAVQQTLERILADNQIRVTPTWVHVASETSPLDAAIVEAIDALTAEFWPGIPVLPTMLAGATSGSFLRNAGIPTYGHSGRAIEITDNRAHGQDERMAVKSFYDSQEYLYRLVRRLASSD